MAAPCQSDVKTIVGKMHSGNAAASTGDVDLQQGRTQLIALNVWETQRANRLHTQFYTSSPKPSVPELPPSINPRTFISVLSEFPFSESLHAKIQNGEWEKDFGKETLESFQLAKWTLDNWLTFSELLDPRSSKDYLSFKYGREHATLTLFMHRIREEIDKNMGWPLREECEHSILQKSAGVLPCKGQDTMIRSLFEFRESGAAVFPLDSSISPTMRIEYSDKPTPTVGFGNLPNRGICFASSGTAFDFSVGINRWPVFREADIFASGIAFFGHMQDHVFYEGALTKLLDDKLKESIPVLAKAQRDIIVEDFGRLLPSEYWKEVRVEKPEPGKRVYLVTSARGKRIEVVSD